MPTGAITEYIDVAQLALYAFWVFFAGLIYYLHQENKREGYPLESETTRDKIEGFPPVPAPKTYLLGDGRTVTVPSAERNLPGAFAAEPIGPGAGAPLVPLGDPLLAGAGPGAYAQRTDVPDRTAEGKTRIVPLSLAAELGVAGADFDPRGLPVLGADGRIAGTVRELWVDRAELLFRYLEVSLKDGGRSVLLPINFARINARGVRVASILASQFANVPTTRSVEELTLLEEERIMAYYGAGTLYAEPSRAEPLL